MVVVFTNTAYVVCSATKLASLLGCSLPSLLPHRERADLSHVFEPRTALPEPNQKDHGGSVGGGNRNMHRHVSRSEAGICVCSTHIHSTLCGDEV